VYLINGEIMFTGRDKLIYLARHVVSARGYLCTSFLTPHRFSQ